jgi:ABC-type uncharacterized transport system substrate-binding protein
VFVESSVTLVFDENGLAGFRERWLLDEMFTAFLLGDFDANANQEFESEEIAVLKAGAFDNLREFRYFTHILIEGEPFELGEATSFSAEMSADGRAIYNFFIPCPIKAESVTKHVMIAIFDDTYYCDVLLVKEAIGAQNHEAFSLKPEIKDLPELIYYFDQVIPEGLSFTFSQKP